MQRRSTRSMKKSLAPVGDLESPKPVGKSGATRKSTIHDSDSGSSDSDEDLVIEKQKKTPKKQKRKITDSSSSESDIETYLKSVDEIDLNSSFFKSREFKDDIPSFDKIEKEIFSDIKVTRLSDSDSSGDEESKSKYIEKKIIPDIYINDQSIENEKENIQSIKEGEEIALLNFQKLQDYSKKMEEAKRSVEQYQAKQTRENVEMEEKCAEKINIEDLLAIGEAKKTKDDSKEYSASSSSDKNIDKESYSESEQEDWEEIIDSQTNEEQTLIPNKELEITVEMPSNMKKKKGNDLLASIKRRLNRVRKENQVLIHKVHLLCWIAHGNYVNSILNDPNMLSLGLSLMPSEKSFPSGRIDLNYLEQILKWFKKTVKLVDQTYSKNLSLEDLLIEQFSKKEAYSKSMLAIIFIVILRSLGVKCRLVLSLQVEPLRPPNSDLHFTGNNSDSKDKEAKTEKNSKKEDKKTTSSNPDAIDKTTKNVKKERVSKNTLHLEKLKIDSQSSSEKRESSKKKNSDVDKELGKKSRKSLDLSKRTSSDSKSKLLKDDVKGTSKYFKETGRKGSEKNNKHSDNTDDKEKNRKSDSDSKKKETEKRIEHNEKKEDLEKKHSRSRQSRGKDRNDKTEKTLQESEKKTTKDKKYNEKKSESKSIKEKEKSKYSESRRVTRSKSKSPSVDSVHNVRSKSSSTLMVRLDRIDENHSKLRSKSSSSSKDSTGKKSIPQLDGMDDSMEFKGFKESPKKRKTTDIKSFEEFYSKIYKKVSDESSSSKANLKNLNTSSSPGEDCKSKKHKRSVKKPSYVEKNTTGSEDDFEESPRKKMRIREEAKVETKKQKKVSEKKKVNLQKLKSSESTGDENIKKKSSPKTLDVRQDIMNLIKGRISEQKHIDRSKMVKKRKPPTHESDSEDSDYVPEPIKKKHHDSDDEFYPKMKIKKRVQVKDEVKKIKKKKPKDTNSRRVISSDSEYTEEEIIIKKEEPVKKKRGNDTWLEVFLDMEEKWICVDVVHGQAHCINELFSRASHPVSYVLAWNNSSHVKDITRRYCQNYNTVTRKLRTDAQWWEESLKPYLGPKNARDKEEDDELDRQQQEKPLPTTISEYKNHPLYALERHLLKFEALYPPNAAPLGYVRNEPVYSRDCVFVCHSRDIWLKQAKVVKRKEQPYKIVKARPKYDKLSNTMITDQMLEIFGPWQVEDYDPPTAENGMVPRNAFGNVDLFKQSMLPKKCVHLKLPGLNKTARRLNIDCASAIVGFDFHGGWSHPVYDGFIVCEEYEDELVAAWNIEQEEQEKKEQEKYEKRVYGNWKKLIKGLKIKERLKAKYGFGKNEVEDSESSREPKEKKSNVALKKKRKCISDSSEEDEDKK